MVASGQLISHNGLNQSFIVNSQKKNLAEEEKSQKLPMEVGESSGGKAKKLIIKPPERKVASTDDDKPWSFAEYLKYGLIIIIVVALLLFLFGQMAQISKSMEK